MVRGKRIEDKLRNRKEETEKRKGERGYRNIEPQSREGR